MKYFKLILVFLFFSSFAYGQHRGVEKFENHVWFLDTIHAVNGSDSLIEFLYNHKIYFVAKSGIDSILFLKSDGYTPLLTNLAGSGGGGSTDSSLYATHYFVNHTDSVGTITYGVWNATVIDTAYTNAASQVTSANSNISVTKEGKSYKLTGNVNTTTPVGPNYSVQFRDGNNLHGSLKVKIDTINNLFIVGDFVNPFNLSVPNGAVYVNAGGDGCVLTEHLLSNETGLYDNTTNSLIAVYNPDDTSYEYANDSVEFNSPLQTLKVNGSILARDTIHAANYSGTSSGTNTGDQAAGYGLSGTTTLKVDTTVISSKTFNAATYQPIDTNSYFKKFGISGGQTAYGGTASGNNLTLHSTTHATLGKIFLGSSIAVDETNTRLGIGFTSPVAELHIDKGNATASALKFTAGTTTGQTSTDGFNVGIDGSGNVEFRNYENTKFTFFGQNNVIGRMEDSTISGTHYSLCEFRNGGAGYATAFNASATNGGFAMNRNPITGAIYNSSLQGFQFAEQGNGLEMQVYYGNHNFKGYGWVIDTNMYLGIGLVAPKAQLHQQIGNATATYHKFTAGTTTGATVSDGFDVGIDASGNAALHQNENLPMYFYTNNALHATLTASGALTVTGVVTGSNLSGTNTGDQLLNALQDGGAIASGGNYTISSSLYSNLFVKHHGSSAATTWTEKFPSAPLDNQTITIYFDAAITTLTWDGNGATVDSDAPSAISIKSGYTFIYTSAGVGTIAHTQWVLMTTQ